MKLEFLDVAFGQNKNFPQKNEITFNLDSKVGLEFFENEIVRVSTTKGKMMGFITFFEYEQSGKKAYVSSSFKNLEDGKSFNLEKIKHVSLNAYSPAKISNIKNNVVNISSNIIKEISDEDKILTGLLLVNKFNGYKLNVPIHKIIINEIHDNKIELNIKQRKLLDIDLPTYICQKYLDELGNEIKELYPSEKENLQLEPKKETGKRDIEIKYYEAVDILNKATKGKAILSIYPVYKENKENKWNKINGQLKKPVNWFLSFLVGQNKIELRVARPYPIDESENIVRITKENMEILGLKESDKVIIRNNELAYSARIMALSNYSIISNENRIKNEADLSLLIGIPTFIRNELGLQHINGNVSIERDLKYLFKKNLNKQILPMVGLLISIKLFDEIQTLCLRVTVIIIVSLIFLFFSFSEARAYVDEK